MKRIIALLEWVFEKWVRIRHPILCRMADDFIREMNNENYPVNNPWQFNPWTKYKNGIHILILIGADRLKKQSDLDFVCHRINAQQWRLAKSDPTFHLKSWGALMLVNPLWPNVMDMQLLAFLKYCKKNKVDTSSLIEMTMAKSWGFRCDRCHGEHSFDPFD